MEFLEFFKPIDWKELMVKNSKPPFVPKPIENARPQDDSPPQAPLPPKGKKRFNFNELNVNSMPEYLIE